MAIDTALKRFSAINHGNPWRGIFPIPDGSIDDEDRLIATFLYGGLAVDEVEPADPIPVFDGPSIGTLVMLVDEAMSSIDFSARFSHSTDSLTYELTGTLPAGLSFATDTLSGTPTETGTFGGLVVTATDENTDTATSDTFTIRVVAEFSAGAAYGSLTINDFSMRI